MQFAYHDTILDEPVDGDDAIAAEMGEFGNLAPLLAGARARGVADAFEMLGVAAIFIDRTGTVLHVGKATVRFFGKEFAVVSRHLVTRTAESNLELQDLIASAIHGSVEQSVIIERPGRKAIRIRALPIAGETHDDMQMLRAVLVVEETKAKARVPQRRSARQADDESAIHA